MRIHAIVKGLLLAAGLVSVGCGPTPVEATPEDIEQAKQSLVGCPAGYSASYVWKC